jgi:RNA recognition motif-containing protein
MTSKKNLFLCAGLALIGGVVFSQFAISPALSFLIGVVATAFLFSFSSSQTPTEQSTDSEPSTKTLYVGNLPYKANENHVRDLFAEYGQVYAVRLMKDKRTGKRRGFGFVVMAAEDAKPAISKLNEKVYLDRTLKVRIANDPKHPEDDTLEQE